MITSPRYEDITETTGIPLSPEGAEMLYTRYALAAQAGSGHRVLELGCGAGLGFGLMGRRARSLVGGDYSPALLADAQRHYLGRFPFLRLTAEDLPFRDEAFELVVFFEATYYVTRMDRAFAEIARVLAPGGEVLIANANPERSDFIRSPHSTHYHTADEFRIALERVGLRPSVSAAFPVVPREQGPGGRAAAALLGVLRRGLEGFGLVPRTLRGRARLKRLIYGALPETPAEVPEGFARAHEPEAVSPGPVRGFKVIYVRGQKDPVLHASSGGPR